jgi:carbon-monoxide dehydrogenase large subunit
VSSGTPTSGAVSVLDRPNSHIGRSVPRPNARRLLHGRGQFVDDIVLPPLAHVAFWRSPFAQARIKGIEREATARSPGVIRVVTGAEIAKICSPWVGVLAHHQGIKSAPQYPLAMERTCWQGEAVAAVVASARRAAEHALERLAVDLEELPAVTDMASALVPATPLIHPELGDNLTFERKLEVGDVDGAFENAAAVVEHSFGRNTGVTLEPRAILADYDPAEHRLTIYHSFQTPHMMQDIVARHLGVPAANVRVICRDVGGSFGLRCTSIPTR